MTAAHLQPRTRGWRRGDAEPPSGIDLVLTAACDLRCAYCPILGERAARPHPAAFMDTAAAVRLMEDVCRFRPMIRLFGGEPLLHLEWQEIVHRARRRGFCCTAVSNGVRLAQEAERVARSGLYALGVSLDGTGPVLDMGNVLERRSSNCGTAATSAPSGTSSEASSGCPGATGVPTASRRCRPADSRHADCLHLVSPAGFVPDRGLSRVKLTLNMALHVIRHLALACCLILAPSLAAQAVAQTAAPAGSASVAGLLARYGVRAIEPSSPASDFTLPNLAGGETSLSDYYGSWVVLTFFATWCGPCRSELPTLERLHRERATQGIVVLGVSVDADRAPLDPFVRQLGLSFPIVWDQGSQAGAVYRASSIPTSYLVDPGGRLVGVSRGARDWSALGPMLDAALTAVPASFTVDPQPRPPGAYADAGEPVATPSITDPPTAELALSTPTPEAGEAFYLDIRLHWAGNFDEYLPHPPQVRLPEGVVQEAVTAESSSRDGGNRLTYRIALRAERPGKYALDPVELLYTPRLEAAPVASRLTGPTVDVVPRTVLGVAPAALGAGAGLAALVGLAGWGIGRRLRRPKDTGGAPAARRYEELRGRFEAARKKRLVGDGAGYLLALAELDRELDGDSEPDEAMRRAVERARYGGEVPPAEELDKLQRQVERRLAEMRPDPQAAERRAVQLRDGRDSSVEPHRIARSWRNR